MAQIFILLSLLLPRYTVSAIASLRETSAARNSQVPSESVNGMDLQSSDDLSVHSERARVPRYDILATHDRGQLTSAAVQSMLKTTTETGDVSLFSLQQSRPRFHGGAVPSPSMRVAGVHRPGHRASLSSTEVEDYHMRAKGPASDHWNSHGSAPTSIKRDTSRRSSPGGRRPRPDEDFRSLSLTQSIQSKLLPFRNPGAGPLLRDPSSDSNILRSPLAYPAQLGPLGSRSLSPRAIPGRLAYGPLTLRQRPHNIRAPSSPLLPIQRFGPEGVLRSATTIPRRIPANRLSPRPVYPTHRLSSIDFEVDTEQASNFDSHCSPVFQAQTEAEEKLIPRKPSSPRYYDYTEAFDNNDNHGRTASELSVKLAVPFGANAFPSTIGEHRDTERTKPGGLLDNVTSSTEQREYIDTVHPVSLSSRRKSTLRYDSHGGESGHTLQATEGGDDSWSKIPLTSASSFGVPQVQSVPGSHRSRSLSHSIIPSTGIDTQPHDEGPALGDQGSVSGGADFTQPYCTVTGPEFRLSTPNLSPELSAEVSGSLLTEASVHCTLKVGSKAPSPSLSAREIHLTSLPCGATDHGESCNPRPNSTSLSCDCEIPLSIVSDSDLDESGQSASSRGTFGPHLSSKQAFGGTGLEGIARGGPRRRPDPDYSVKGDFCPNNADITSAAVGARSSSPSQGTSAVTAEASTCQESSTTVKSLERTEEFAENLHSLTSETSIIRPSTASSSTFGTRSRLLSKKSFPWLVDEVSQDVSEEATAAAPSIRPSTSQSLLSPPLHLAVSRASAPTMDSASFQQPPGGHGDTDQQRQDREAFQKFKLKVRQHSKNRTEGLSQTNEESTDKITKRQDVFGAEKDAITSSPYQSSENRQGHEDRMQTTRARTTPDGSGLKTQFPKKSARSGPNFDFYNRVHEDSRNQTVYLSPSSSLSPRLGIHSSPDLPRALYRGTAHNGLTSSTDSSATLVCGRYRQLDLLSRRRVITSPEPKSHFSDDSSDLEKKRSSVRKKLSSMRSRLPMTMNSWASSSDMLKLDKVGTPSKPKDEKTSSRRSSARDRTPLRRTSTVDSTQSKLTGKVKGWFDKGRAKAVVLGKKCTGQKERSRTPADQPAMYPGV